MRVTANPAGPLGGYGADAMERIPCFAGFHRAVPPTVDQTLEAELPPKCPHCGGAITENDVFDQYQTEIPEPRVERIRFRVHLGCCQQCGRSVQGRHPRQTSDASGAAAPQLGPRAVALATQLNKGLGLPYGKTSAVLKQAFGLEVTPGGVCQAIARAGRKAEPTFRSNRPHRSTLFSRATKARPDGCRSAATPPAGNSPRFLSSAWRATGVKTR